MRPLIAILFVVLAVGCRRNELYYPQLSGGDIPVRIELLWGGQDSRPPVVLPTGFYSCFYPNNSVPFVDYLSTYGGELWLNEGRYSILTFNNDTQKILYRNTTHYSTFEAFTPSALRPMAVGGGWEQGIVEPDILYVAVDSSFDVYPTPDTLVVEKHPRSVVGLYEFVLTGVEGIDYVSAIRVSISGMPTSMMLTTGQTSGSALIFCNPHLSADGFDGSFRSWIESDAAERHIFKVEFFYLGGVVTYTYDVTDQLHATGAIKIHDGIKFEPTTNGGFDTEVGDWNQTVIEIPI